MSTTENLPIYNASRHLYSCTRCLSQCFSQSLSVAGLDFTFDGPLVFSFETGMGNTACISINITDDVDYAGERSFTVMLSETPGSPIGGMAKRTVLFSSPSGPLIGPNSMTVVTINDSEGNIYIYIV